MANTATIAVRVEPEIKNGAAKIAKSFGLDLTTALRMFVTQIYKEHRIPVDIARSDPNDWKSPNFSGEAYLKRLNRSIAAIERGEYKQHDLIRV